MAKHDGPDIPASCQRRSLPSGVGNSAKRVEPKASQNRHPAVLKMCFPETVPVMTLLVTRNFLEDMALVMCLAAMASVVCQLLRQPVVVGYLRAGMVVGPHVLGLYASSERIRLVADLGATIVIFSIGLEFRVRRLLRLAPTAGLLAVLQAAMMVGLGYLLARYLMGWSAWDSLVTGAIVSISGAVIVARAFEEVRVESRVRELVFGVVLSEDIIGILVLAVLITLAKGGSPSLRALTIETGLLGSFIIGLIVIGQITVPYVMRGVALFRRPETLLITSLGLCFAFAMIAERLGYTFALGAFLAGSLVSESRQREEIGKLIEPVRYVFSAIFFVAVGMLIDPRVLASHWQALAVLCGLAVAGKVISVSLAATVIGERPNTAIKAGFAMAQIGMFAILFAQVGTRGDDGGSFLYSLTVALAAVTTLLCPLMVRMSGPVAEWIDRHLPASVLGAILQYGAWMDRIRGDSRKGAA